MTLPPSRYMFPLTLLALVFLFENVFLAYNNLQNKTPIFGLTFEHSRLIGKNSEQIKTIVKRSSQSLVPIRFSYKGKIYEVSPKDIGFTVDDGAVTNTILQVGRQGTFIDKLIAQHLALLRLRDVKLSGTITGGLLTIKILELQSEVDQDAKTISIDFSNDQFPTLSSKEGNKIQVDKLTQMVAANISHPPVQAIPMPMYKVFPRQHAEKELDPIRKSIPEFIQKPLSITSAGIVFTLTPADLRTMLTIVERPDPKNAQKTVLLLRLDDQMLNRKLGTFAEKAEAITGAEFNYHDARVAVYAQFFGKIRRPYDIPTGYRQTLALKKNVLGTEDTQGPKTAYLTFDDGPNSIYHPMVLDILKYYHVAATFFLVGQNTSRDKDVAVRTYAESHKLGNHSLTHSFLPKLSQTNIVKELKSTNDILKPIFQRDVQLFRPPYGGLNAFINKTAADLSLKIFLWDVDPRDWTEPETNELVRRVVDNTHNGSDILLHSNHLATVKALPKIIEQLRAKGYEFKTLE